MVPVLLNMTRDDCRRTLRRLELEAYSNMVSVLRAQGPLEDSRRKILENLRDVLHIGNDRHSAEARRAANDELLATIAEQLSGPNTGLDWISEGRRLVPLMPRGVPQTMYTEIADRIAIQTSRENEELKRKLENRQRKQSQAAEMEIDVQLGKSLDLDDELLFPPIVTEDQSMKILEAEALGGRKRKATESSLIDSLVSPTKVVRNISQSGRQKHLNLSQIYSDFSKTPGKASGHSKHSYNQVSKVSTKSNASPRTNKRKKQNTERKSKIHKSLEPKFNTPISLQMDLSQPPNTFQASYAQSILSMKNDSKSNQNILVDSPTMRLLTQPATTPHEIGVSQPEDTSSLQAQSVPLTPIKTTGVAGKPCQFIIKKRNPLEKTPQKIQLTSDINVSKKLPVEGMKIMPAKKPIVVAPQKINTSIKMPPKIIQTPSKAGLSSPNVEKMVVVSGTPKIQKTVGNPKNIILTSSNVTTPISKSIPIDNSSFSPKIADSTPKGIAATDVRVSSKTIFMTPRKMVVVPQKPKPNSTMPLVVKNMPTTNMPTTVKLVSMASNMLKSKVTVVSRPATLTSITNSKILPLNTSKLQDKPRMQGIPIGAKVTAGSPIVRPSTAKGNVIFVQKGTPTRPLTFSKTGEMSKIVIGKDMNKLIQAQNEKSPENAKKGNIIVLDLNNQLGPTTMSKILDNAKAEEAKETLQAITEDTPVLFETTENASSLDSLSTVDIEDGTISSLEKDKSSQSREKDRESIVTDWEIELDSVGRKRKSNIGSSPHLELCMSSDSETDAYLVKEKKKKPSEENSNITEEPSSLFGEQQGFSNTRTLLSQLQDSDASSNDSAFKIKGTTSEKEMKVATQEPKSQTKRLDILGASDLAAFLEGEDMFDDGKSGNQTSKSQDQTLEMQLSQLLAENAGESTASEMPLSK